MKLERVAGYAPALPVWKTGALLLDDTRNQGPGGMCPRAVIVSPGSQLVPEDGVEPPAPRSSGERSTAELLGQNWLRDWKSNPAKPAYETDRTPGLPAMNW